MKTKITNVTISQLSPNPANPRRKMDASELQELSQSIAAFGILQPITVRPLVEAIVTDEGDVAEVERGYEIVCGHRRYEAAKLAGLESVPCIIRDLTDDEAYEIMVTENLQRKDIDPFEEAAAFNVLKSRGHNTESLAIRFGKSATYILSRLKLNNLLEGFRKFYDDGKLDLSHCLFISRFDANFQTKLKEQYYDTKGYYNLLGRSFNELKNAAARMCHQIRIAMFDNSGCARCPKNTACDALFTEFTDATCEDPECWNRKTLVYALEQFEIARERYPEFFVLEPGRLTDPLDIKLADALKERGFKFVKGNSYDYERAANGSKYIASDASIIGFSFDWMGFFVKKTVRAGGNSSQVTRYKEEWCLNNLAREMGDEIDGNKIQIALDRIEALPSKQRTDNYQKEGWNLIRHILLCLVEATGEEFCGLSPEMDGAELFNRVNEMSAAEVADALTLYASRMDCPDEDRTYLRSVFPEEFKGNEQKAEQMFWDDVRECWHGYGDLTDEMIREDIEKRKNK